MHIVIYVYLFINLLYVHACPCMLALEVMPFTYLLLKNTTCTCIDIQYYKIRSIYLYCNGVKGHMANR